MEKTMFCCFFWQVNFFEAPNFNSGTLNQNPFLTVIGKSLHLLNKMPEYVFF
jgi:hypothetical protein